MTKRRIGKGMFGLIPSDTTIILGKPRPLTREQLLTPLYSIFNPEFGQPTGIIPRYDPYYQRKVRYNKGDIEKMTIIKKKSMTPVEKISLVLFKHDPMGFAKLGGVTKTEYLGEAKTIHGMLMNKGTASGKKMIKFCDMTVDGVEAVVYATFISSFGEKLAGDRAKFKPIAETVLGCVKNTLNKTVKSDYFNGI